MLDSHSPEAFFEDRGSALNIWQCGGLGFLCPSADLGTGSPCQGHGASVAFFSLERKLERNFGIEGNIKVDLYLEVSRHSYGRVSTKSHTG